MPRTGSGLATVINAWFAGRAKRDGDYSSDGSTLRYHNTAIAEIKGTNKIALRTAGYGHSISTRTALNQILAAFYGAKSPQYVVHKGVLMLHYPDAAHPLDEWDIADEDWMDWSR